MSDDPRDPLEAALDAARAEGDEAAPLPEGLAARMMADAATAQPRAPARAGSGWRARLFGDGGLGWPAATGLAAAALAGLWIGYAPPPALDGVTRTLLGTGGALGSEDAGPADLLAPLAPEALDV